MRSQIALAGLAFVFGAVAAHAQEPPCGVSTVKETVPLIYPSTAKAAHLVGTVVVRANFRKDGTVSQADVQKGHALLQGSVLQFVQGLHANEYESTRTCLVNFEFKFDDGLPTSSAAKEQMFEVDRSHSDALHYVIVGYLPVTTYTNIDPVSRRKRFLGIF
jgi:hypothetical protein